MPPCLQCVQHVSNGKYAVQPQLFLHGCIFLVQAKANDGII